MINTVLGRLESLVNFQTMVKSLTGMDIANASLLDEATAAAEGMVMAFTSSSSKKHTFFVDASVSPQTIAVIRTRCSGFGINLEIGDTLSLTKTKLEKSGVCGVLVQYPDVNGSVRDFAKLSDTVHEAGGFMIVATDLLALTMLKPPGEWGADVVLGSSARFGVPAGYGGPHAAFFATTEKLKRKMPGRLIGLSKDTMGNPAYRLALQSSYIFHVSIDNLPTILQPVNSIFVAKRQPVTFALVKLCSQTWPPCMLSTTDLKASSKLPLVFMLSPNCSRSDWKTTATSSITEAHISTL